MLRNRVSHTKYLESLSHHVSLTVRNTSYPLKASVRSTSAIKSHAHLIYTHLPDGRPRKAVVAKKYLKWGEPVTPTAMLGDMVKAREFKFNVESLNARGFLRFQKPYTPPPDAEEKTLNICNSCIQANSGENLAEAKLDDAKLKYEMLTKTSDAFNHTVPNSMLHMMCTVGDLVEFYCTPVNTNTPYEELIRNPDLPPNLHVQKEPLRFNPEQFGGQTAFNKSSTIVTGLRSRKKYPGYEAKMTWP